MRKSFLLLVLGMMLVLSAVMPAQALEAADIKGYNKSAGYQYVLFGSYPTDADGTVRPILWRVLRSQGGEAFLLSEYILFASPLHADYEHYNGWESSDLYAYLNSEFKDEAFSAGEQAALLVRTEDNALVTLITGDDMKDASIGFSSNAARQCESTAWAKRERDPKKLTLYSYSKGHKYSPWWSRTRSTDYQHQQRRETAHAARFALLVISLLRLLILLLLLGLLESGLLIKRALLGMRRGVAVPIARMILRAVLIGHHAAEQHALPEAPSAEPAGITAGVSAGGAVAGGG